VPVNLGRISPLLYATQALRVSRVITVLSSRNFGTLDGGGGGQTHALAASNPEKTRYPLYRKLGETQDRSGWAESFVPTGIRYWTVQPVVSRFTH